MFYKGILSPVIRNLHFTLFTTNNYNTFYQKSVQFGLYNQVSSHSIFEKNKSPNSYVKEIEKTRELTSFLLGHPNLRNCVVVDHADAEKLS